MRTKTWLLASSVILMAGAQAAYAANPAPAPEPGKSPEVKELVVVGSRIPRVKKEGPSPVTVITADAISQNGFTSVPDVLRAMSQNGGETQSQQSMSGASFTPGAQQVDLRGLGPNHTLVLVNGRRIADFPLPFKGRSNFTDISNIPLGMIDKIEVLSGSASAIYGSDAISGVVNFNLKTRADGTTLDYRYGDTQKGGGASHRFSVSTGFSKDKLDVVFGAELTRQNPLWAWKRSIQDSTADDPTTSQPLARRTFLRYDPVADMYVDPGQDTCKALSGLNKGTTYYAYRKNYGNFCGSNESVGYGTVISQREGINTFTAIRYQLDDKTQIFADIQAGYSTVKMFRDVLKWEYQDAKGSEGGNFYNAFSGGLDSWSRQFTPEESGGFKGGMIRNIQKTLSITPGIKTKLWGDKVDAELTFNHSQYDAETSWPMVVNAKATALFLGAQQGVDAASGLPIFNADPARLYRPLTKTEFDQITTRTTYNPKSQTDTLSLILTAPKLIELPAGPLGAALVLEAGSQSYNLRPDPLALVNTYYGLRDSDGKGSRDHAGAGIEVRAPVLKTLQVSGAARYDAYRFAGSDVGKFTYNLGAEYRPIEQILFRSAYGTGFRAPDLHYVFSGVGNTHPSGTDYYRCRTEDNNPGNSDCKFSGTALLATRVGNRNLKPETSTSFGYGVVLQPFKSFDISVDYFDIRLKNEVLDMDIDTLLREEADCRLGGTTTGGKVDPNSPTCRDTLSRIVRNSVSAPLNPNQLTGVRINPINVALERTSGIDVSTHYRLQTDFGRFLLTGSYTWVDTHATQRFSGDKKVNVFDLSSNVDVPREKGSLSLNWTYDKFSATIHGQYLGKLPNYDQNAYIKPSYLYNASVQYQINDQTKLSVVVDNLFDKMPPKDKTYGSWPYYDISWFDSVGRSVFVQLTYKLK